MSIDRRVLPRLLAASFAGALLLCAGARLNAQDSGGFELHADKAVTAKEIGLPIFPGAKLYKDPENDSVDMGFTFGETHFRLLAVEYVSEASPEHILDYYRKPLSRYGEVLECDHGRPVGTLTKTRSGLSCDNHSNGSMKVNGISSDGHELRAGTPERIHMVGISEHKEGQTRFGLVYMELPKDKAKKD